MSRATGTYLVQVFTVIKVFLNTFYLDICSLEKLSSRVTQHAYMFMSSLLDIKYSKSYLISILLSFISVLDNYRAWTAIDEH